jgi:hypothetical protein
MRLHVPEKATKQYNFIFLPAPEDKDAEAIIFTVPHGPLKSVSIPSEQLKSICPGPDDILESALNFCLTRTNTTLTTPSEAEFSSSVRESHRKNDVAYHVRAHRGSKDGYLFFLSNGIFFGFKKPLAFFAFEDVQSISYTSVLQRTFNLNIKYRVTGGLVEEVWEEVEFSMLDQADFAGIDDYVKRHGLQDASLAEERRAKKLKSTPTTTAKGTHEANVGDENEDEDGRTELEKAQQQLDDEEDEEEEDYDPGSDGESEGSGASSDEDGDEEFRKVERKARGRDLVADELGSEAEDVSVTEDEDEDDDGEIEGENQYHAGKPKKGDEGDEGDEGNEGNGEMRLPGSVSMERHQYLMSKLHGHWAHQDQNQNQGEDVGMPDPNDEDQL